MIPENQITLLENGEAYFPAIEAALDRAVHEIYLESYIFANAYFLPGLNMRHALMDAAGRGVRLLLLLQGRVEYRFQIHS